MPDESIALTDCVLSAEKRRRSFWVCLMSMFVLANLDVGVTQRDIVNVSRVIEDLLDTYDIRLRPRFGGRRHDISRYIALLAGWAL